MSDYDNTNRASIWRNNDKREGKQDADFTGTVNIEGKEYWINLWGKKEDAHPKAPVLSGTVRAKDEVHNQGMAQARQAAGDGIVPPKQEAGGGDFDDDIPFAPYEKGSWV